MVCFTDRTDININIEKCTGSSQDLRRIAGGIIAKMGKIGVFSFAEQCLSTGVNGLERR